MRREKGITLVALIITIIILVILVGVSVSIMLNSGIIGKSSTATENYALEQAKEKLELALSGAKMEKYTNPDYDQEKYLTEYIESETGAVVLDDTVNLDGYLFEIDRSVPKISMVIGKGQKENTIKIRTAKELIEFRNKVNAGTTFEGRTITLERDINLNGTENNQWIPIGSSENKFKGNFDGKGYTIEGLYINTTTENYKGLFGYVEGNESEKNYIKNIKIGNSCKVTGGMYVASVVGYSAYCNISYCINNGKVIGYTNSGDSYNGGICGFAANGSIYRCANNAAISGSWCVGGIVGASHYETISECYNTGNININSTNQNGYSFGGIIGCLYVGGKISNCYNTGDITGKYMCGGILGSLSNGSSAEYCYNKGSVTGTNYVGSVIGCNGTTEVNSGSAENCYYLEGTGNGVGEDFKKGGTATTSPVKKDNFYNTNTTSTTSLIYLLNNGNNNPQWTIQNKGYPILKWQIDIPTSISLNKAKHFMATDKTLQLEASLLPEDADGQLVWRSSDESVATVNQDGNVTSLKEGTTIITAKTSNNLEAQCKITVSDTLYLYNKGNLCEEVTGGWGKIHVSGNSTLTLNESTMSIYGGPEWNGCWVSTTDVLDYSGYSKYCYKINSTNADSYVTSSASNFGEYVNRLYVMGASYSENNTVLKKHSAGEQTYKVDISSLTLNAGQRVGFAVQNKGIEVYIYEVWLEK